MNLQPRYIWVSGLDPNYNTASFCLTSAAKIASKVMLSCHWTTPFWLRCSQQPPPPPLRENVMISRQQKHRLLKTYRFTVFEKNVALTNKFVENNFIHPNNLISYKIYWSSRVLYTAMYTIKTHASIKGTHLCLTGLGSSVITTQKKDITTFTETKQESAFESEQTTNWKRKLLWPQSWKVTYGRLKNGVQWTKKWRTLGWKVKRGTKYDVGVLCWVSLY